MHHPPMTPTRWVSPSHKIQLDSSDVHLWLTSLDSKGLNINALRNDLDEHEIRRAESFRFESDYTRYVVSHALLRRCLGSYLAIQPGRIVFAADNFGKPYILDPVNTGISFNLSHSGDFVLFAFAKNREIGVDIEFIRPIEDIEYLVNLSFSMSERAAFRTLPAREKLAAFFRIWVQKEAYLKACGLGLSIPPGQINVTADSLLPVALHNTGSDNPYIAQDWLMHEMTTAPGYMAVAAIRNGPSVFSHWTTTQLEE